MWLICCCAADGAALGLLERTKEAVAPDVAFILLCVHPEPAVFLPSREMYPRAAGRIRNVNGFIT